MSTATYTPLLPANQTDLEGALVKATDTPAATDAAVAEVKTLYNPDALRTPWLPWLAWAWDTLYWPGVDQELLRRKILRESFGLHRIAGTLASYKRVARYAGVRVAGAIRPPDKTFLGAKLTTAQRNAWLRRFPQLRLYPFRSRGKAVGAYLGHCYLGAMWPAIGDAAARIGERAFLYRDGVETPLVDAKVVTEISPGVAVEAREVRIRSKAGKATFLGGFMRFLVDNGASKRLYRIQETTPYDERTAKLRITAARPSLEPIRLQYDWVAEKGHITPKSGIFLSCRRAQGPDVEACRAHTGGKACGFLAGFLVRRNAGLRIQRRLYLFDPSVPAITRGRTTHLNATRFGMPPYNAVLRLDMRRRFHRRTGAGPRYLGHFHLCDFGTGARVRRVREALAPLRPARDRVQLLTHTHGPLVASSILYASPVLRAGSYHSEVH